MVPMTLGRDRALVTDTARAMQWLTRSAGAERVALAQPFGTITHLVGWLRVAAGARRDADALLVTAPSAGPDEDAELYRTGRLVRQFGTHRMVEVAFDDGDPDVPEGIDRCRRLGARRVARVPAGFDGPLLSIRAAAEVLHARTARALHLLGHGDNGIASALAGDHGHSTPSALTPPRARRRCATGGETPWQEEPHTSAGTIRSRSTPAGRESCSP
ncbi:sirohydrochlorin chelatase [Kitasatospora aburaviensis]